jgi:hypothetical protein
MNKKMSFFRFCRRSLTALPVFFALISCDKLLPPTGGSGVDIPVKIRAVGIAGGAQNKTVTRAGGDSRVVGEPVIQDMGGGLIAEITLDEDVEALRDGDTSLGDEVQFRVIAVNINNTPDYADNTVYSYADYEVDKSGNKYEPVGGYLHVITGNSYYFICISYNSTTDLPTGPAIGQNLSSTPIAVSAGSNDLLLEKTVTLSDTDISAGLSFPNLTQQLVKVKATINAGSGRRVEGVTTGSIGIKNVASSGGFNLKDGELTSISAVDPKFNGWKTIGEQTVKDSLTFFKTTGTPTLTIPASAVSVGGTTTGTAPLDLIERTLSLANGKSYTLSITIIKSLKFAASNIYWNNSKLTFEPFPSNGNPSSVPERYYQGVYFKWGSLIGVAAGPDDGAYSTSTTLYRPTDTSIGTLNNRVWEATTGTAWYSIPYRDGSTTEDNDLNTLLDNSDFSSYKGDICNFIDNTYRMPTGNELKDLAKIRDLTTANINTTKVTGIVAAAGTRAFTGGSAGGYVTLSGLIFPASGWRHDNSGKLTYVGYFGYYWSGSSLLDDNHQDRYATSLCFAGGDALLHVAFRYACLPVRCLLDESLGGE